MAAITISVPCVSLDLRADRVDLAVHLLHQKVQFTAARLRPRRQRPPVLEVAAHAHDFLVDVRSGDEPDDFLTDGRGIAAQVRRQIGEPFAQPRFELRLAVARLAFERVDEAGDRRQLRLEIDGQEPALGFAHHDQRVERFGDDGIDQRGDDSADVPVRRRPHAPEYRRAAGCAADPTPSSRR